MAKETGDLLDERLGGEEGIALLCEVLDGTVNVSGVGRNGSGHAGAGDMGEPGCTGLGWHCGRTQAEKG